MSYRQVGTLLREARALAGLSQRELAERARTAQSVVARIENGDASPSFDTVSRLLAAASFDLQVQIRPQLEPDPVIEAYKRDIDRSLLRANLKKSPAERVASLQSLGLLAREAGRAGRAARRAPRRRR